MDTLFSNILKLEISRDIDVQSIKNKNVNSEDILDHCTLCTKSCIPADYMLSLRLEGAAFEGKRMKNSVFTPLHPPSLTYEWPSFPG